MPECTTLGGQNIAVNFIYDGNIQQGVVIHYENQDIHVDANLFTNIIANFNGRTVAGGFTVDDPANNGFGEWIENNSDFSPKHASRIAAILVNEGIATHYLNGKAVYLIFN